MANKKNKRNSLQSKLKKKMDKTQKTVKSTEVNLASRSSDLEANQENKLQKVINIHLLLFHLCSCLCSTHSTFKNNLIICLLKRGIAPFTSRVGGAVSLFLYHTERNSTTDLSPSWPGFVLM